MKYIKIANKSNGVNRLHLEKLGLSTKRSDPDTIGQFGSGIKYAPIAALRMGLDFVFVGSDDKGDYQLRYTTKMEDGINCIVYNYGTYIKESSFTADAGTMSWDNEWQIYREVISNAKDNGEWYRDIVEGIKQVPGEFAVYITASSGMKKIYINHDMYFSESRHIKYHCNYTDISFIQKCDPSERIYCKTVLVHSAQDEDNPSMFDYNIGNAELNEDRALKYISSERIKISKAISRCHNQDLIQNYMLDKIVNDSPAEFVNISEIHWSLASENFLWRECFHEKYGKNAVLVSPSQSIISGFLPLIKSSGKKPIICKTNAAFLFLSNACRIQKAEDFIGQESKFDIQEDISEYPKLLEAMKVVSFFEPGLRQMSNSLAVFKSNDEHTIAGITINMSDEEKKRILISSELAKNGGIKELVATIIHEYDHYTSGFSDSMYREFRDLADKRLGNLMYQYHKDTPVFIHKDEIKIKTTDLHLFQTLDYIIEYLPKFGWHLVRIGKLIFRLDIPEAEINEIGVCSVDETGDGFRIKIAPNSQIQRIH
jgi:hypothetical protein